MSERLEKIADEILAVVNKKRVSGETPEKDVWVATYLPNREQIAVIFGDREVSGSYVQKRFNKNDKQSIISELEKLYGNEPKNHNEEALGEDTNPIQRNPHTGDSLTDYVKSTMWRPDEEIDEDTVYDHSWYEVEKQKYPKRTKEGVMIKEEDLEETCSGGATCAGAVCAAPGSVASVKKSVSKVTRAACLPKRKKKKMSESIDSILFKESILNDMPCESKIEGHQFKYFMNEGKWYLSVNNCLVKTHDKGIMMETFDQIVDDEKVTTSLLEDYSCYEMELLMEDEENATANPNNPDNLTGSPANNDLPQPGIAMDMALNKDIENNEKERNYGKPEQPETSLQQQEEQEYDKNELEKLKGQKVFHRNPKTKKLEPVTLGDKINTSNGKPARSFTTADGKPGADYSEELLAKETL